MMGQEHYGYPPGVAANPMLPPTVDGSYGAAGHASLTSWRSATGMIVPPPARPALRPADEFGFAVSVQWPAVAQAAAYVVELREAGSTAFERFVRSAPEAKLGTLVELRVGGLRPGPPPGRTYVAQVRTVAVDGSESEPSPPGVSAPLPSTPPTLAAPSATPVMGTSPGSMLSADSAPFQPSAAAVAAVAAAAPSATAAQAATPPPVVSVPSPGAGAPGMSNWA